MANSTATAFAKMRDLKRNLAFKLPSTYVFTDSVDVNGCPVLTINQDSTPATTEQNVVLRIKPESLIFVNSIGQVQEDFAPHDVEMVVETGAAVNTVYLNATNSAILHTECAKTGCIFKYYLSANGAVPAVSDFTAANLKLTLDPDIYNKLTAQ